MLSMHGQEPHLTSKCVCVCIQERGINEDLGEYLRHLMFDKELKEYEHWLSSVKSFVA